MSVCGDISMLNAFGVGEKMCFEMHTKVWKPKSVTFRGFIWLFFKSFEVSI